MIDRAIVLIDMDCFYVQVEQKFCPEFKGKPCAVVQYNNWQGGGIIAVNYEARAHGVKRGMRGDEAKLKCPDICLFRVPEVRGKADLTRYRDAGKEVIDVLCSFNGCVERASIDEAYIDLTDPTTANLQKYLSEIKAEQLNNTYVVGWEENAKEIEKNSFPRDQESLDESVKQWLSHIYEERYTSDIQLAMAAAVAEEMRAAVFEKTGFHCSAGIANNKMLAKLACGIHKPNKQTILPQNSVPKLFSTIPIGKVRNLGGKLGEEVIKKLGIEMMSELADQSELKLQKFFGSKTGAWLYSIAHGIENESVSSRQLPQSIGCGKNFPGKKSLAATKQVQEWLLKLSEELEERLQKDRNDNKRIAKTLTVSIRCNQGDQGIVALTRSGPIYKYKASVISESAFKLLQKFNSSSSSKIWNPPILSMAMSAGKFEESGEAENTNIEDYFSQAGTSKISENNREYANNSKKDIVLDKDQSILQAGQNIHKQVNNEIKGSIVPENSSSCGLEKKDSFDRSKPDIENYEQCFTNIATKSDIARESSKNCIENQKSESNDEKNSTQTVLPPRGFFARKMAEFKALSEKSAERCTESKVKEIVDNNSSPDGSGGSKIPVTDFNQAAKKETILNAKVRTEDILLDSGSSSNSCDSNSSSVTNSNCSKLESCSSFPTGTSEEILSELTVKCSSCDKLIPIWEEQEHSDFHLARELEKELCNSTPVQTVSNTHSKTLTSKKRGQNRICTTRSKIPKTNATLDKFLHKSNDK